MSHGNSSSVNNKYFQGLLTAELPDLPSSSRYPEQIITASWNAPATRVACSKTDGSIKIWRQGQMEPTKTPPTTVDRAHEKPVESLSWRPTMELVLATVGNDPYVKVWNTLRGQMLGKVDTGESRCFLVQYSGDGKYIVAVTKNNYVVVIDADSFKIVTKIKLSLDVYSVTWNNTSAFLFVGMSNGSIEVYSFEGGKELKLFHTLKGHRSSIKCLFFERKARFLAAAGNEGVISLWSLDDFKVYKTIGDVDQPINSLNISRDGTYISATFEDGAPAKVYDLESSQVIYEIPRCVSSSKTFASFDFCPTRTTYIYTTPEGKVMVAYKDGRNGR